jgi:hypothetical protein
MANRQSLNYNSDELAHNLKQSTGRGVDALFSPPSPPRPDTPVAEQREPDQSAQASVHARTHASQHRQRAASPEKPAQVHTAARVHAAIEEELRQGLLNRRWLSSFTFRFRAEELEDLDRVAAQVNRGVHSKISKNDIVRLGLNWLLQDHAHNKENSMLASVLKRV